MLVSWSVNCFRYYTTKKNDECSSFCKFGLHTRQSTKSVPGVIYGTQNFGICIQMITISFSRKAQFWLVQWVVSVRKSYSENDKRGPSQKCDPLRYRNMVLDNTFFRIILYFKQFLKCKNGICLIGEICCRFSCLYARQNCKQICGFGSYFCVQRMQR